LRRRRCAVGQDRKNDQVAAATGCHAESVPEANGRDRLRELLDVIVDSLAEPRLSGADVAGRAFLSRFHFDRLVAAATGEAPEHCAAGSCSSGRHASWRTGASR